VCTSACIAVLFVLNELLWLHTGQVRPCQPAKISQAWVLQHHYVIRWSPLTSSRADSNSCLASASAYVNSTCSRIKQHAARDTQRDIELTHRNRHALGHTFCPACGSTCYWFLAACISCYLDFTKMHLHSCKLRRCSMSTSTSAPTVFPCMAVLYAAAAAADATHLHCLCHLLQVLLLPSVAGTYL
jgi:hypothetical protein